MNEKINKNSLCYTNDSIYELLYRHENFVFLLMANVEEGTFFKVIDLKLENPRLDKYKNSLVRVVETTRVPPYTYPPGFYESDGISWKPFPLQPSGATVAADKCFAIAMSIAL